jgi:hypothetical protein
LNGKIPYEPLIAGKAVIGAMDVTATGEDQSFYTLTIRGVIDGPGTLWEMFSEISMADDNGPIAFPVHTGTDTVSFSRNDLNQKVLFEKCKTKTLYLIGRQDPSSTERRTASLRWILPYSDRVSHNGFCTQKVGRDMSKSLYDSDNAGFNEDPVDLRSDIGTDKEKGTYTIDY